MRLQLAAPTFAALVALPSVAHADGSLTMRGVYYKERSTRVEQPMLDGLFELGARGLLAAHVVIDAVTSASAGSGAANAVPFSKQRYEAGASYTHEFDGPANSFLNRYRLKGELKYSDEPDYKAFFGGGGGEAEVAEKNAVLGIGGGLQSDRIGSASAQGPYQPPYPCLDPNRRCPLTAYSLFASASQIVSRRTVVAVNYDLNVYDGFQQNPYRLVLTSDGFIAERHPDHRTRQAFALSARYYLPQSETTFIAAYRYYTDNWDVHAHTPEIRVVQQVGRTADAALRYRYYTQTSSFFAPDRLPGGHYAGSSPAMNPSPNCKGLTDDGTACFTDDPKMTKFDGHAIEAKLGIFGETFALKDRWSAARFEGILEYVVQNNRFGNAIVAHVALTVPFSY
jgi:hypothetical protein